jgi:D-alanyl-D-alanine carboxypeptidase
MKRIHTLIVGLAFFGTILVPFKLHPAQSDINQHPQVAGVSIDTDIRGDEPVPDKPPVPSLKGELSLGNVSAKSFLVYDAATGSILAEEQPTLQLPIASITKLMTAYLTYRLVGLEKEITISSKDTNSTSPALGLIPGDTVQIEDVFSAMLIGSDNDAALTLSNAVEAITHQKFIDLMNNEAGRLGMTQTHFSNPLGFDSGYNFSSASDLKKLIDETQKLPSFTTLSRKTAYNFTSSSGKSYHTTATNKLLVKDPEIYAIKTGYTEAAGGAMAIKAIHEDRAIIIVVLGSSSRENDVLLLKKQIFENYSWQ